MHADGRSEKSGRCLRIGAVGIVRVKVVAWLIVGWYHGDEGREMLRDKHFPDLPQIFGLFLKW